MGKSFIYPTKVIDSQLDCVNNDRLVSISFKYNKNGDGSYVVGIGGVLDDKFIKLTRYY